MSNATTSKDTGFSGTPAKRPPWRPFKEIDRATFEALCRLLCTEMEICSILGVDDMTLVEWCQRTYGVERFSEIYKRFSAGAKAALRRDQFRLARTSPTMAIWLGKQLLGQTQRKDVP